MSSISIFLEHYRQVSMQPWIYVPLLLTLLLIMLRNNQLVAFYTKIILMLALVSITILIDNYLDAERSHLGTIFFTIAFFLLYLIKSPQLLFPLAVNLALFILDVRDFKAIAFMLGQSLLVTLLGIGLNITLRKFFHEKNTYISVEYTRGGYRRGDVSIVLLLWLLSIFVMIILALYQLY